MTLAGARADGAYAWDISRRGFLIAARFTYS
jgi:hypothetical protein